MKKILVNTITNQKYQLTKIDKKYLDTISIGKIIHLGILPNGDCTIYDGLTFVKSAKYTKVEILDINKDIIYFA